MTRPAAAVAADLRRLGALDRHVTRLTTPVALDLVAALLDVSRASTGVALLLYGVATVPGEVPRPPTGVAGLLPLLLGLLTVPGDVARPPTVVAGVLLPLTVSGHVSRLPTAIAEEVSTTTPASVPPSSIRTALGPVTRPAAVETLVITAHHHSEYPGGG